MPHDATACSSAKASLLPEEQAADCIETAQKLLRRVHKLLARADVLLMRREQFTGVVGKDSRYERM